MAKLTAKKFDINTFNGSGEEYKNGNAPLVKDFNDMAKGIAYLNENGGSGGNVDLSNYYTKAEVNSLIISTLNTEV